MCKEEEARTKLKYTKTENQDETKATKEKKAEPNEMRKCRQKVKKTTKGTAEVKEHRADDDGRECQAYQSRTRNKKEKPDGRMEEPQTPTPFLGQS